MSFVRQTAAMRLLTIAAASVVLAAPATAAGTASLSVKTRPFTVHGVGFKSNELVRIVVEADSRHTASVRARADGTFSIRMIGVDLPRCSSFLVRAIGARGTRVSLKHQVPECSPQ